MAYLRLGIKRFLPKSLFGRSLLIIVLPVALMQIAVTYSFFEEHWETVTARLSESVAGDVAMITTLYQRSPEDFDQISSIAYQTTGLYVDFRPDDTLPLSRRSAFFRALDRTLRRALSAELDEAFWFDTTRYPLYVDIRVQVDDGVLRFIAVREKVFSTTGHIFLIWIIGASTLLTAVSIIFIRNQVKPILRLASAAEALGRGQDVDNFKPAGATEVRQAAQAFLAMSARLKRHIQQRTALLAGVSHDLRTPLTRLKLQLALMKQDEDIALARKDLDEMEAALDEYLAFARGDAGEELEEMDLSALVEEIAADCQREGHALEVTIEPDLAVHARRAMLKRAINNLVQNALSFADEINVHARRNGKRVEVIIDDNGPGIPVEQREDAFKAFNRLDESRNANRKGVGLGLAIARDTARAQGGEISLDQSPQGGLRAVLSLPV